MAIISPISGSFNVRLVRNYATAELIERWQKSFKIDITSELHGHGEIELYECLDTGLYFFMPLAMAGSEYLYQQLQQQDFYYMKNKWEYEQAMQLLLPLLPETKVLEVGCGRGYFVNQLKQAGVESTGLELNQAAVQYAQANKLPVHAECLEHWAHKYPGQYTHICSFQVLEHIPQPKEFIQQCLACLAPNGRLILGVPNRKSFTRHLEYDLLDMPPHHMARWDAQTFQALQSYLPIQLENIFYEPLGNYHVSLYANIQIDRLWRLSKPHQSIGHKIIYKINKIVHKTMAQSYSFILHLGLKKYLQGHSLLVSFRKL
ncbi:hemolytic protein HlpA-like [Gloeomargarita lithophora Alchichica-D10]|uniref:Hemolytic protein HlpA-like n=1 Tax=Gloeomargarita lithophora Alchichica-D10 TaxID=1188229 RepID=A0A1J0ADA2_9CYAN|nr:class I SAM-dependent methyltransferase [Gloeomargarita lithophora]APB33897.1 hemolytic protein HlpA-like [Gloeomargarita lithophora Alchichica-D10]